MFQKHKEAKLHEQQQHEAVNELRELVAGLPDESGAISIDGFRKVMEFAIARQIDFNAVPDVRRDVRLGLAEGGQFIEAKTTLLLKQDETPVLDANVNLLKEVADRRYQGGSQGISVPLGHGVRYRVGEYRGRMVTVGHHWETADNGQLTVTDKRVVFRGARKTLEFPFAKLASLHAYSDAIVLGVTTRQATSTFGTPEPDLITGLIHAVVAHPDDITILRLSTTD